MIAFALSFLVTVAGFVAALQYGFRRRAVGADLSWGEAIAAATFVFFLFFFAYGVVPHQWLTYSGNELSWRPDKVLLGPGDIFETFLPFTMSYETLSHIVVVGIYGVFLVLHVAGWSLWQGRGKKRQAELPRTAYGRPLVKQT